MTLGAQKNTPYDAGMGATRDEIRQAAVEEGWTLQAIGDMDVFTVDDFTEEATPIPIKPIPPLTFLWRNGKMYRPAGGGMDWDWEEDNLSADEVRARMCVALYFLHELGLPYTIPADQHRPSGFHRDTGSRSGDTPTGAASDPTS
jgi:hypothetical protein